MFERYSPYVLWGLLALPAAGMLTDLSSSTDPKIFEHLMHPTGETAARLLIFTLMITPLTLMLPRWRGPRWLRRNRRYFGVAAFGYAALHALFYLVGQGSLTRVLQDLGHLSILAGWLAFAIFIPLAATSTNAAVRRMGPKAWQDVRKWTYAAAVLVLVHWAAFHHWHGAGSALVHFGPLATMEAWRFWFRDDRRGGAQPA